MEMFLILKIIEYHFDVLKGTVPCLPLSSALKIEERRDEETERRETEYRKRGQVSGFPRKDLLTFKKG